MSKNATKPTGRMTARRRLAALLALTMLVCLTPLSASAAGSGSVSLDKAVYMPGEDIFVTYSGITGQMVQDNAYISIYKAGAAHSEYMSWNRPEAGSGQMRFTAPAILGSYEMRLYKEDYKYTADTFVMSVPFTVSMHTQGKISLEKNAYQAQQEISVTVTEISPEMVQTGAFVAIYKKGAKHNEYGTYKYPSSGDSILKLKAPNENGEFEMRLYGIDRNYTDESFIMSVPFTLSGAVQEQQVSSWAKTEIDKARDAGLIPNILKSADLTKPITREEFCELALLLYEKTTGKSPAPASPNPFTDTNNSQILKAFSLGITQGTSATTFSPQVLINREQCAAMLFRTIKAIHPDGDYSIAGVSDFPDQKSISAYAVPAAKYMSKLGIIKGDNKGNFMPKATTTAQTAAGYGMATREAALLMSVRTYEKVDQIKESKGTAAPVTPASSSVPAAPQAPAEQPKQTDRSIVGSWQNGGITGHAFNGVTGTFQYNSGIGQLYIFKSDGTFSSLIVAGYGNSITINGKYAVKDGKITFSNQESKSSSDYGQTWKQGNSPADATYYYTIDKEGSDTCLIMGLEGATPPLDIETNAVSYTFME